MQKGLCLESGKSLASALLSRTARLGNAASGLSEPWDRSCFEVDGVKMCRRQQIRELRATSSLGVKVFIQAYFEFETALPGVKVVIEEVDCHS